jgi:hypothetical protein
MVEIIIFCLVWFLYKKIIRSKKIKKETKTSSNRPVLVRFDFLEQKPVRTGLA